MDTLANGTREEMTSVTKLDLTALFELERIVLLNLIRQHIHQLDVVIDSNNNVKSTGMDGDSLRYFTRWTLIGNLKSTLIVIPDVDESFGACDDELFAEADVHTGDLTHVEL